MALTASQKNYLKGLTHYIKPVVIIADKGLNENVCHAIHLALNHHELIKIKIRVADKKLRNSHIKKIVAMTHSELIHSIGQMTCIFKRNTEHPKVVLPNS